MTHLGRQWAEKMANALLVLHVHVEIANHRNAAIGADALLPATKLAGFHVALHNVYAIFLVERYAGDFIEADYVKLAYQSALTTGVIDKHACNRSFTS